MDDDDMMTAARFIMHHAFHSPASVFLLIVRVEEDPMTQRTVSFRPAAQHTVTRNNRTQHTQRAASPKATRRRRNSATAMVAKLLNKLYRTQDHPLYHTWYLLSYSCSPAENKDK
jgi:hypothetical protein